MTTPPEGQNPPYEPQSFARRTLPGDDHERSVCDRCGYVAYENPKVVAGSVASAPDGRLLLARRAIEPRDGYWTLPAGYMEMNESVEDAARREAREEAGAELDLDRVLAIYSVPRIGQVQVMFRARLTNPGAIAPGVESREVGLFAWQDLPWDDFAFPTVHWALRHWREAEGSNRFGVFSNPVEGL